MTLLEKSWNDSLSERFIKPNITLVLSPKVQVLMSNLLFIISFLAIVPVLILIWKVASTNETGGLVLYAFYLSIGISVGWFLYGLFILKNVIVAASSFSLIVVKCVLVYMIINANKTNDEEEK